jgi:hypothetical protein
VAKPKGRGGRTAARSLCRHFVDGALEKCAKAGLGALRAEHRSRIRAETVASCSVDLEACRRPHEGNTSYWDYVITLRDGDSAIAVEPHPAAADQVDEMIRKKSWALALLQREARTVRVVKWFWLTGSDAEPYFSRNHPAVRRLAEAGIEFPLVTVNFDR